jgi:GAF domain-containing protein
VADDMERPPANGRYAEAPLPAVEAPVFDAMLEKALRLCEVDIGTLWIYDGKMVHAAAVRGAPPQLTEFLAKGPHLPARLQLRVLSGAEPLMQIPDITETEAYRDGDPIPRAIADLGGVRTLLIVPLRKDDAVLGNFAIHRREPQPFTDKQIALLQNFAAQAVITMENARLLTETRGLGAADRDRRGVAGHQQLARRPHAGLRRDAGEGNLSLPGVLWYVVDL